MSRPDLVERLEAVRSRIVRSSADPASVRVVAVTKGLGGAAVADAVAVGLTDLGENYADELRAKAGEWDGPRVDWHFLGAVQRNKVARLAPLVTWWQALRRIEEGRAIAGHRPGARVLVQVDVAGLPGRGGCPPEQVPDLVAMLGDEGLTVEGLMAVGPPGPPELARPGFALVSALADRLGLAVRSMGMSDDLEVALAEGSTMVRLGRALFGDRPPRAPRRGTAPP